MGKLGVVVGRFQGTDLTEGHMSLLHTAFKENGKLLVLLGNHPLQNTMKDPLDFQTRVKMILGKFPDAMVSFVRNQETDEIWVEMIEKTIAGMCPMDSPILYWGRDSSVLSYTEHGGKHPVKEIAYISDCSSTKQREEASRIPIDSTKFRRGIIYATYNKFPNINLTVDIACISLKDNLPKIVLGKKYNSPYWRFPGGFVEKTDNSHKVTAMRELREEVGPIETSGWEFIDSCRVDDWRYDGVEDHYIMTNLYYCEYNFGNLSPDDDLEFVKWFDLQDLYSEKIELVECHKPLVKLLEDYLNERKTANA